MEPFIILYVIIGLLVFIYSLDTTLEGWLSFARAVFWPILMLVYLGKYSYIAFKEVWED